MAADNALVAFLGSVFGEILKIVTDAIRKTYMFKSELEDLKSTLESITLTLQEMEKLNEVLDIPQPELSKFCKLMVRVEMLVLEISKVKRFSIFNGVYADKIIQMKKSIETFFYVDMQTQMARDNKRILVGVDSMLGINENGVGVFNRSEIDGPCSVPDSLASTPVLDVLTEMRTDLLEDDGMQVIVVAPGGAGMTTLIEKLCADDQVKDKFQENILFVTVSQTPDVKFTIQRIFQQTMEEVLAFQMEEVAINDFKRLLKNIGQAMLLVLDDVWSESVLQKFKFKLFNCKILVTSRSVSPQFGSEIFSPFSPIPQVPAKPESLPMKCQWQKGKLIGRGTFGSVYVASNRETGALCAMKEVEMFPDDPKSAECIKQLEQEIKVLSNLKHPNIVQYYGSEIVGDKFYIYLEYVHPGSINKYVREYCRAMTESIVCNFTFHILSGLAYLHSKRTIHRDIKGANLLVDASGVVKLADFGVAKHLTGQTADLSLKGSPYWIAPELITQRDYNSDLALAVDIWSLGCTVIEMYTGKPPWSEFERDAAMFKVMNDTPSIPESLSTEGKDFLRCCFQRNPADRPLASKLLEHRFLKNSQQQPDVPSSYLQSFSGMELMDKPSSPREQSESKIEICAC